MPRHTDNRDGLRGRGDSVLDDGVRDDSVRDDRATVVDPEVHRDRPV